jgi:hypothetical protein
MDIVNIPSTTLGPWEMSPFALYENLSKHHATPLMPLRLTLACVYTHAIYTNLYELHRHIYELHRPYVILMHYPRCEQQRADLIRNMGSEVCCRRGDLSAAGYIRVAPFHPGNLPRFHPAVYQSSGSHRAAATVTSTTTSTDHRVT